MVGVAEPRFRDRFLESKDGRPAVEALLDELGVEYGRTDGRGELAHQCFHAPESHAHGDRNFSATSNVETGLWYCHVCCTGGVHEGYETSVRSAGRPRGGERASDLPDISQQEEFDPAPMGADRYEYRDQDGKLVFWIVREQWWDDERGRTVKKFVPHHRKARGACVIGLPEVRPLYKLPELISGVAAGRTIYIVEGEKDADAMTEAGEVATCNVGGAGKFGRAEGIEYLRGAEVVIVADRDDAGLRHALDVEDALKDVAATTTLAMAPVGKDAADWLYNGGDPDEWDPVPLRELDRRELESATRPESQLWLTGRELGLMEFEPIQFLAYPIVPELSQTLFIGDLKAGKTTYLMYLVNQVVRGESFLGQPTIQTPVVYLTEQHIRLFAEQAHPGLFELDDLSILSYLDRMSWTWPEFMEAGIERCLQIGAKLMIVDTAGKFARLDGDSNNSDGAVRAILAEVSKAQGQGIAVLLSKHERKSGGEITKAASGSHAWGAEADQLVRITRQKDSAKHQRRLQIEGRFYDAMGQWLVEYNPETHELTNLGEHEEEDESETATRQTARRLKNSFELWSSSMKVSDLYSLHPELSESLDPQSPL